MGSYWWSKREPGYETHVASEGYEAWRHSAAHLAQQTLDLVAAWDRLIEQYRTQLAGMGQSRSYDDARDRLKKFGQALAKQSAQLAALRRFGPELGVDQRPALQRIINSHDPARETAHLVTDAERQQRRQAREDRQQQQQQHARAQLRRSSRDPGSRGR